MKIHTVRAGERISDIAKLYGVSEETLRRHNTIERDTICEGEELLILIPTRTYMTKPKDSPNGVAARFGITPAALVKNNPELSESKMPRTLTLKYAPPSYGSAAANGYFYKGCSGSRLVKALPYLTYATFAEALITERGCIKIFDASDAIKLCKNSAVVPLVKFFDKRDEQIWDSEIAEAMIEYAKKGGFYGITLELSLNTPNKTEELLLRLREKMIGNDLILISEIDGIPNSRLIDYSDGCCLLKESPQPSQDYIRSLSLLSEASQSAKTFVELPAFGAFEKEYIQINEAQNLARRSEATIETDEATLLSSFDTKRKGRIIYPSLRYIKAILDAVNEYGYMGVSFDISRIPPSYLYAFGSLFKVLKSYTH